MISSSRRAPRASTNMYSRESLHTPTSFEQLSSAPTNELVPQGPTPPDTPPTRTIVESALDFIQKHQSGYNSDRPYDDEDFSARISIEEEKELCAHISTNSELEGFVNICLAYIWYPPEDQKQRGCLIIRMTTHIHAEVAAKVIGSIYRQVCYISAGVTAASESAVAASLLIELGSDAKRRLRLDEQTIGKVPDGSLNYNTSRFPPLLLEETRGQVKTSIAIKIEAQSPEKRATEDPDFASYVSFRWKNGRIDNKTPESTNFRKNSRVEEGSLQLRLSNICPEAALTGNSEFEDPVLSFPHVDLNEFILKGHMLQRQEDDESNVVPESDSSPVRVNESQHGAGTKRSASSSDFDKDAETEPYSRATANHDRRLRKTQRMSTDKATDSAPSPPAPSPQQLPVPWIPKRRPFPQLRHSPLFLTPRMEKNLLRPRIRIRAFAALPARRKSPT
ncbi:hypothetical protein OPT61_g8314 [Boeremia exigua]|uniref:Uncharacterized protein n=1 Tax=Boeremia exigua TaxID=749465 RepID=A0ACC2HYP7_9PLEO|nr:hypothetical protein OPT61_g8314 [Boeremia exigua]